MVAFPENYLYGLCRLSAEMLSVSCKKLSVGTQYVLQGIKTFDDMGERAFNGILFTIRTKWKLLLFISCVTYCILRLFIKTSREVKPKKDVSVLTRLFYMIKNAHKPGMTTSIISLLEKNLHIDVNRKQVRSDSGLTIFLCACLSGDQRLVSYMLSKGADINAKTACKDSPLHLACFSCATQNSISGYGVITVLLKAGCNINSKNWLGNTPLCIAASSGKCNLIRHLLALGADKGICNNDEIYAMDFATNAGHLEAAKLLAIDVPNPHVWDIIEPHTPPRIKLGLQSPCKQHLVYSSFRRRRMDFCTAVK